MDLYEKKLKKIIKFIEKYGHVTKIEIANSELYVEYSNEKGSVIKTFNDVKLKKPNKFIIQIELADTKSWLGDKNESKNKYE